MAKEEPITTEEKVETPNTPNEWSDDYSKEDLTIPYKREEKAEEAEEKVEETNDVDKEEVIEQAPANEEAVVTTPDPGEFTPSDYSFEVKIGDETVKVTSVEQAEKLATDKAEELDAKALLKLMTGSNKMALGIEREEKEHQDKKAAYEEQVKNVNEQNERVTNIVKEFDYLISKGNLPAIAPEYKNADWSDPKVADQPGIKEQRELLSYMQKENKVREKAGLSPIVSVLEAYSAWKLENDSKEQEKANKAAGEARKAAGAKVSSISNNPAGQIAPSGIAVGRTNVFRSNQSQWDN